MNRQRLTRKYEGENHPQGVYQTNVGQVQGLNRQRLTRNHAEEFFNFNFLQFLIAVQFLISENCSLISLLVAIRVLQRLLIRLNDCIRIFPSNYTYIILILITNNNYNNQIIIQIFYIHFAFDICIYNYVYFVYTYIIMHRIFSNLNQQRICSMYIYHNIIKNNRHNNKLFIRRQWFVQN